MKPHRRTGDKVIGSPEEHPLTIAPKWIMSLRLAHLVTPQDDRNHPYWTNLGFAMTPSDQFGNN
jgi:hypothetical protein